MIIYNGEDIVVHRHLASSRVLYITFQPAMREDSAETKFFGMRAVDQGGINCIGITTKTRSFYLCEEMGAAVDVIRKISRNFERVIVIGHSMGGYAALKYSRALGADRVVAFSPNYSLDGDELDLPSDAHRKILERSIKQFGIIPNSAYKSMGITSADCSGKISIIYDPHENIDSWYIDIFKKRVEGCDYIPFEGGGHDLGTALEEGDTLVRLVRAIDADELDQVRRIFLSTQRASAHFIIMTMSRALHCHPLLSFRAMYCRRVMKHRHYQRIISDRFNGLLVYKLFQRGFRKEAYQHMLTCFRAFISFSPSDDVDISRLSVVTMVQDYPCLLLSSRGLYIVFNAKTQNLEFSSHFTPQQSTYPVILQMRDGRIELNVATSSGSVPAILPTQLGDGNTGAGRSEIAVGLGIDHLTLRTAAGYLTCEHDTISFSSEECPSPEAMFVPMPLKPDSPFLRASSAGWFDQKLIAPAAANYTRPRTKGLFELFKIFRNQSERV